MSITSYPTRSLMRGRSFRPSARSANINPNDTNANDELTQILNQLHINDLLELREIEISKQIPIAPKPELQAYFKWKRGTTSIAQKDSIIIEIINIVIMQKEESKEEEPSPYNNADENGSEVTQDAMIKNKSFDNNNNNTDDDEEYDPSQDPVFQPLYNAKAAKTALDKNANEYIPGLGKLNLSVGGNTALGPIAEEKTSETGSRPEIKCDGATMPHSPSTSSLSSAASILTQPPSITNSPPPTTMVDITQYLHTQYLQSLQQFPDPSYFTNTLITSSVPNTTQANIPAMQPNYLGLAGVPAIFSPPPYPVIIMPLQATPQPVAMSMPNNALFSPPQTAVSVPMINQFSSNNITVTQPTQQKEQKEQKEDGAKYGRQFAEASKTKKFQAKFNNHAKGNFYISKVMIGEMIQESAEEFDTEEKNDEKLAFGHYKESVAMSINDKQIDDIFEVEGGKLMIIINIDLHFKSNPSDVMYLIAMENDVAFRDRVRWCIIDFMSAQDIFYKYGITHKDLPKSSRNMKWFKNGINRAPLGFNWDQVRSITRSTHFKTLPKKTSKRATKTNEKNVYKSRISQQRLKHYVEQSLLDDTLPIVPVVVIKGKNQCIEWKRFVQIEDDNGYTQYVGISLKFYEGNKQWKIECMDYDSGRVYYQHRLASLPTDSVHNYSYDQVSRCITTSMLDIYDENRARGNYRNRNYNRYDGY